jgi:hypothetical protein
MNGYGKERMQLRILPPLKQFGMIIKRFGLLFYLKKLRGYVSGDRPIYLRITVDGTITELSIQRSCNPDCWNARTCRANCKTDAAKPINAYLHTVQARAYQAQLQLTQAGSLLTAQNIKLLVLGRKLGACQRPRIMHLVC